MVAILVPLWKAVAAMESIARGSGEARVNVAVEERMCICLRFTVSHGVAVWLAVVQTEQGRMPFMGLNYGVECCGQIHLWARKASSFNSEEKGCQRTVAPRRKWPKMSVACGVGTVRLNLICGMPGTEPSWVMMVRVVL
jgi:hypothetical protein